VTQHALAVEGPIREYYLVGPTETRDESLWRTEIGWPIFETRTQRDLRRHDQSRQEVGQFISGSGAGSPSTYWPSAGWSSCNAASDGNAAMSSSTRGG
jgi:hypothetical protein